MALLPFEFDGLLTIDCNEPVEYIPKLLIVSRSVSREISTSLDFKKLSIPDVFNSPPTTLIFGRLFLLIYFRVKKCKRFVIVLFITERIQ